MLQFFSAGRVGKKKGLTPELVDLIFYAREGGVNRKSFGSKPFNGSLNYVRGIFLEMKPSVRIQIRSEWAIRTGSGKLKSADTGLENVYKPIRRPPCIQNRSYHKPFQIYKVCAPQ